MVYGAINEKGENLYTDMWAVFGAMNGKQMHYNWLITDAYWVPYQIEKQFRNNDYYWLTGEKLNQIVSKDHTQWVWAVLSGFDKRIELAEILEYPLPYADGNGSFWKKPISMQHPLATIEIVPWDASLTLFFSDQEDLVNDFLNFFPYSEEFSTYLETLGKSVD